MHAHKRIPQNSKHVNIHLFYRLLFLFVCRAAVTCDWSPLQFSRVSPSYHAGTALSLDFATNLNLVNLNLNNCRKWRRFENSNVIQAPLFNPIATDSTILLLVCTLFFRLPSLLLIVDWKPKASLFLFLRDLSHLSFDILALWVSMNSL